MAININLITKDEYLTTFNMPELEGDKIDDKDYQLIIMIASMRIKFLSNYSIPLDINKINEPYLGSSGIVVEPEERIYLVKLATALLAKAYADRGVEWIRSSGSTSMQGVSISTSNPDEPDYIPNEVLEIMTSAGFFEQITLGNVNGFRGQNNRNNVYNAYIGDGNGFSHDTPTNASGGSYNADFPASVINPATPHNRASSPDNGGIVEDPIVPMQWANGTITGAGYYCNEYNQLVNQLLTLGGGDQRYAFKIRTGTPDLLEIIPEPNAQTTLNIKAGGIASVVKFKDDPHPINELYWGSKLNSNLGSGNAGKTLIISNTGEVVAGDKSVAVVRTYSEVQNVPDSIWFVEDLGGEQTDGGYTFKPGEAGIVIVNNTKDSSGQYRKHLEQFGDELYKLIETNITDISTNKDGILKNKEDISKIKDVTIKTVVYDVPYSDLTNGVLSNTPGHTNNVLTYTDDLDIVSIPSDGDTGIMWFTEPNTDIEKATKVREWTNDVNWDQIRSNFKLNELNYVSTYGVAPYVQRLNADGSYKNQEAIPAITGIYSSGAKVNDSLAIMVQNGVWTFEFDDAGDLSNLTKLTNPEFAGKGFDGGAVWPIDDTHVVIATQRNKEVWLLTIEPSTNTVSNVEQVSAFDAFRPQNSTSIMLDGTKLLVLSVNGGIIMDWDGMHLSNAYMASNLTGDWANGGMIMRLDADHFIVSNQYGVRTFKFDGTNIVDFNLLNLESTIKKVNFMPMAKMDDYKVWLGSGDGLWELRFNTDWSLQYDFRIKEVPAKTTFYARGLYTATIDGKVQAVGFLRDETDATTTNHVDQMWVLDAKENTQIQTLEYPWKANNSVIKYLKSPTTGKEAFISFNAKFTPQPNNKVRRELVIIAIGVDDFFQNADGTNRPYKMINDAAAFNATKYQTKEQLAPLIFEKVGDREKLFFGVANNETNINTINNALGKFVLKKTFEVDPTTGDDGSRTLTSSNGWTYKFQDDGTGNDSKGKFTITNTDGSNLISIETTKLDGTDKAVLKWNENGTAGQIDLDKIGSGNVDDKDLLDKSSTLSTAVIRKYNNGGVAVSEASTDIPLLSVFADSDNYLHIIPPHSGATDGEFNVKIAGTEYKTTLKTITQLTDIKPEFDDLVKVVQAIDNRTTELDAYTGITEVQSPDVVNQLSSAEVKSEDDSRAGQDTFHWVLNKLVLNNPIDANSDNIFIKIKFNPLSPQPSFEEIIEVILPKTELGKDWPVPFGSFPDAKLNVTLDTTDTSNKTYEAILKLGKTSSFVTTAAIDFFGDSLLKSLNERITTNKTDIAAVKTTADANKTQVATNKSDIASLKTDVTKNKKDINNLSKTFASLTLPVLSEATYATAKPYVLNGGQDTYTLDIDGTDADLKKDTKAGEALIIESFNATETFSPITVSLGVDEATAVGSDQTIEIGGATKGVVTVSAWVTDPGAPGEKHSIHIKIVKKSGADPFPNDLKLKKLSEVQSNASFDPTGLADTELSNLSSDGAKKVFADETEKTTTINNAAKVKTTGDIDDDSVFDATTTKAKVKTATDKIKTTGDIDDDSVFDSTFTKANAKTAVDKISDDVLFDKAGTTNGLIKSDVKTAVGHLKNTKDLIDATIDNAAKVKATADITDKRLLDSASTDVKKTLSNTNSKMTFSEDSGIAELKAEVDSSHFIALQTPKADNSQKASIIYNNGSSERTLDLDNFDGIDKAKMFSSGTDNATTHKVESRSLDFDGTHGFEIDGSGATKSMIFGDTSTTATGDQVTLNMAAGANVSLNMQHAANKSANVSVDATTSKSKIMQEANKYGEIQITTTESDSTLAQATDQYIKSSVKDKESKVELAQGTLKATSTVTDTQISSEQTYATDKYINTSVKDKESKVELKQGNINATTTVTDSTSTTENYYDTNKYVKSLAATNLSRLEIRSGSNQHIDAEIGATGGSVDISYKSGVEGTLSISDSESRLDLRNNGHTVKIKAKKTASTGKSAYELDLGSNTYDLENIAKTGDIKKTDITSSYRTRSWNNDDATKKVRITLQNEGTGGPATGFLSISYGIASVELLKRIYSKDSGRVKTVFCWDSDKTNTNKVDYWTVKASGNDDYTVDFDTITKFEIWE